MPVTTDELIDKASGAKAASIVLAQASTDAQESGAGGDRARDSRARGRDSCRQCAGLRERVAAHRDRSPAPDARARRRHGARCRGGRAVLPIRSASSSTRITRPNGLAISKRRVPLGVVGVVYESRPNVTSDVAAICLKTGNAVVLRGGSEALASNRAIAAAIQAGLEGGGLARDGGAADHVDRSRAGAADAEAARVHRRHHPARRRGADQGDDRERDDSRHRDRRRRVPHVCRSRRRSGDGAAASCTTRRCGVRRSATRSTRCSCTATSRQSWLPKMAAEWSKARVEIHADAEATRVLRGRRRRFGAGVAPTTSARSSCRSSPRSRWSAAWTRRSSTSARHGSGHSEAIVTGGRAGGIAISERGRCGGGVRQRQHAVHRRRRVRAGRRSRHLDAEAARARPDGTARADDVQVDR